MVNKPKHEASEKVMFKKTRRQSVMDRAVQRRNNGKNEKKEQAG